MSKRRNKSKPAQRNSTAKISQSLSDGAVRKSPKQFFAAFAVVVAISAMLNFLALDWGQPGGYPWHSDSITGSKTVHEIPNLFGKWTNKYPRLQFLICGTIYKPYIEDWQKNPVYVTGNDGRPVGQVLTMERMSKLIIISRIVTALMGIGTVISVFLTAMVLFKDILSAFMAGLAMACTHLFVLYSHFGNLDVPSAFWFAWSVFWAVKVVYAGHWRYFILFGIFCALAICTKDPVGGFVVGLGLATWLGMIGRQRSEGSSYPRAIVSIFSIRLLVTAVVFLVTYALLNGIFNEPQAFVTRMKHWIGGSGVTTYTKGYQGQWRLLRQVYYYLYYSFGWPLLAAIALSLIYCLYKVRWKIAFGVLPIVAFYLVVVVNIHLVAPRYLMPGFAGLVLLVGKGCADFVRWKKLPATARWITVGTIYFLSFMYCMGGDLEMLHDSRYQAEEWFAKNVDRRTPIAALCPVTVSPRLHLDNFNFSFR